MTQFPSATIRLRKSKRAHYSRRLTARHRSAACTQRVHAVAQHRLQQQGPVLLRRGALQSAIIRKLRVPILHCSKRDANTPKQDSAASAHCSAVPQHTIPRVWHTPCGRHTCLAWVGSSRNASQGGPRHNGREPRCDSASCRRPTRRPGTAPSTGAP